MATAGPSSKRFHDTDIESTCGKSRVCRRRDSEDCEYKTFHGDLRVWIHSEKRINKDRDVVVLATYKHAL